MGGFDASKNCEVYDEWIDCEYCFGTGKEELSADDVFVPERDALTPND
jgi:hypothetical protein